MFAIHNNAPSSFYSADKDIRVLDVDKKFFYYHPNKEGHIIFNLPKGIFYTDNKVTRQIAFKSYPKQKLIGSQPLKGGLRGVTGKNDNVGSIWPEMRYMLIDENIMKHDFAPLPVYVIGHELGHDAGHHTEEEADCYGSNLMLDKGYNPTQIDICEALLFNGISDNPGRLNCASKRWNLLGKTRR